MESKSVTLVKCIVFTIAWVGTSLSFAAEGKKLMTPDTCASMRYLSSDLTSRPPLQMSSNGTQVAYVLQVPDLRANDNKETLYVSSVLSSLPAVSVLTDRLITAPHWFPDNRTLAILVRRNGKTILEQVDSVTKKEAQIWVADGDITDYSMNVTGDEIAIAVEANNQIPRNARSQRDESRGYRVGFESEVAPDSSRRNIYTLQLDGSDRWTLAQRVEFTSPLTRKVIKDVEDNHALHISLSPNGRYLLIDDFESFSNIPTSSTWRQSPLFRSMQTRGLKGPVISYLYDVRTRSATMPLQSPYVLSSELWAPDSKSYIEVAAAPVNSGWEASDVLNGTTSNHVMHMFAVDVGTESVSEVVHRAETAPLTWTKSGDVVTRNSANALITLREEGDHWTQLSKQQIPFSDAAPYSVIASDGNHVVMEYESTRTPPRLVGFELSSSHTWTIASFNSEADDLVLPHTETVSWTTPSGFTAKGMLLLPPDYDPHVRYPLVVEDGSFLYNGEFVCDSGPEHVPSFARGILADAGVAYLMRYWPGNDIWENTYYSKKYPGQIAEAAFKQELVESAVDMLAQRQLIDPAKIGLVGFSRGGWYVDYALMHSHIRFRAASTTDGSQYSIVEYYLWHNGPVSSTLKTMYGGPPYGGSLKNWIDYSISFNFDRVHTPLLIEAMGYGKKDTNSDNLAVKQEVYNGLSDLKKPVELYYYPNEQHQPDDPATRVASLQRNVDWFRFWLQGYERPNPEDPDQYKRWEHLRELQEGDEKKTAQSHTVGNSKMN